MVTHLVFEVLAGRTVCWAQVPVIAHVVEYFLWMDLQLGQVIEISVNPATFIPLLEIGWWVVRICTVLIEPHHDAAHIIDNRIGANRC